MPSAKDILLKPIGAAEANAACRRLHYSGSFVRNSQLHIGAFLNGRLEGVMQFGPPLDKRKVLPLVEGTPWNGMLELNRMAFSDALPRNSESRALAVAMRLLRKHAPHVQWVLSFADGAQCGDGTIYRAAGFVLTQIKRNTSIWEAPDASVHTSHGMRGVDGLTVNAAKAEEVRRRFSDASHRGVRGTNRKAAEAEEIARRARESRTSLTDQTSAKRKAEAEAVVRVSRTTATKGQHAEASGGGASMRRFIEAGFRPVPGFQLRYIYFLDPTARERLAVPVLPFSAIDEAGARMYRGERITHAPEASRDAAPFRGEEGGSTPTPALHLTEGADA